MTRAFLIGAGATKAQYSNAPLCDNFFELLNSRDKALFTDIKDTIEPILQKKLIKSNVEEVMEKSVSFTHSEKTYFSDSIFSAIYGLLAKITYSERGDFLNFINGKFREAPSRFKTLLNDNRLNKKDFFMTLNYDLYLDREILYNQHKIDYGLTKEIYENSDISISSEDNLSLYHLHGSLNWTFFNYKKINISDGAINPQYRGRQSNLCIIPPGEKDLNVVLKYVWGTAKARLLKSDELIIIGCSLDTRDAKLVNLIKEFINKKGSENVKIIYKAKKDDSKIEDNYKKAIGENFNGYPHGFNISRTGNKMGAIEFIFEKNK